MSADPSAPKPRRHRVAIPTSECSLAFSCSGGPGGQNVNKRETRVQLSFDIRRAESLTEVQKATILGHVAVRHLLTKEGVLMLAVDTHRTQRANIDAAYERLHELIDKALVPKKKRVPTKASRGSKERRLTAKKQRSQTKAGRGQVSGE